MEMKRRKNLTASIATAVARGRQNRGKRTVFIQAEKERDDNRQTATAENVRVTISVFRAKYEQSDKYPKGNVVTLSATIHKYLLCFAAGICNHIWIYLRFYLSNI